jgi:hypothetical protein
VRKLYMYTTLVFLGHVAAVFSQPAILANLRVTFTHSAGLLFACLVNLIRSSSDWPVSLEALPSQ